jgi:hypothetical protein
VADELSAVLVLVPQAEDAVGELRDALDRSAGWGVPAHVTVIFPFLPPDRVGPDTVDRLRAAVATVPRFDTTFTEVRWFGEDVMWLLPAPEAGFRALTRAVWAEFPECPPYGGAFADSQPHLTVGHGDRVAALRSAAEVVAGRLPIPAAVTRAHLMLGREAPGAWRPVAELPLG